jgi:glycosyltransferase involved in cell wall biosynthesis
MEIDSMFQKIDISVVICTYNRMDMLQSALSTLLTQETKNKFLYEIVIIDDGSTDETAIVVKKTSQSSLVPIRYFREEGGGGVAKARNRAIKETIGSWVAFFDDDQLAASNWLLELWDTANRTGADCVGGTRLLHLPESELTALHSITRAFLGEILVLEERRKTDRRWFPNTGNSLVSRTTFDRIGGFNEDRKYGEEDLDFFRKVRMAKLEVWETPMAIVYHLVPSYRLERKYLQWTALRSGIGSAEVDRRERGLLKAIVFCVARLVHAALIALPSYWWSVLVRDKSVALGRRCQVSKAEGYVLKLLSMTIPSVFGEVKILNNLQFRHERAMFRQSK